MAVKIIQRINKVSIVINGVGADGKPFKQRVKFDGEIDLNFTHKLQTASGSKLGAFAVDVQPTGRQQFDLSLTARDPKVARKYELWRSGMWEVHERW